MRNHIMAVFCAALKMRSLKRGHMSSLLIWPKSNLVKAKRLKEELRLTASIVAGVDGTTGASVCAESHCAILVVHRPVVNRMLVRDQDKRNICSINAALLAIIFNYFYHQSYFLYFVYPRHFVHCTILYFTPCSATFSSSRTRTRSGPKTPLNAGLQAT